MFTKCPDCGSTNIQIASGGVSSQSNSFLQKIVRKLENIKLKAKMRSGNSFLGAVTITCKSCGKIHLLCVN